MADKIPPYVAAVRREIYALPPKDREISAWLFDGAVIDGGFNLIRPDDLASVEAIVFARDFVRECERGVDHECNLCDGRLSADDIESVAVVQFPTKKRDGVVWGLCFSCAMRFGPLDITAAKIKAVFRGVPIKFVGVETGNA